MKHNFFLKAYLIEYLAFIMFCFNCLIILPWSIFYFSVDIVDSKQFLSKQMDILTDCI